MPLRSLCLALVVVLVSVPDPILQAADAGDEVVTVVKKALASDFGSSWENLDELAPIQWAPLPVQELKNCMADGNCYARQGVALIAGRKLMVIAAGSRTIVASIYIRNASTPFGEKVLLGALQRAGIPGELARCPAKGSPGGTNWYRLRSTSTNPATLAVQTSCGGKPCEGFVLTLGEDLPPLQLQQVKIYSENCSESSGGGAPVASKLPHEQLAEALVALLPAASAPALDWKALQSGEGGIVWESGGPKRADLSFKGDPNPMMLSGNVAFAGRKFSAMASGTPAEVKVIYLDEMGLHPRGEHVLGVVYDLGYPTRLARCGPVYTESTNNWYSVSGATSRPAMLRQSIRYDGNQVQDSYELRLDGTLPKRDARDRDPGVGGCR